MRLLLILLIISSCIEQEENDQSRFHDGKTKLTVSKERKQLADTKVSDKNSSKSDKNSLKQDDKKTTKKNFLFPLVLTDSHTSIQFKEDLENKKKISTIIQPETKDISIIASFDGTFSVTSNAITYIISILSKDKTQKLFFQLSKEKTKLLIEDKASIVQKTKIATTTSSPIIFYLKRDNKIIDFCFSITQEFLKSIKLIKDDNTHPNCS